VHAFRRDELMTFSVKLQGDRTPGIALEAAASDKKMKRPSA
jgi:hypothetical protein